MTEFFENLFQTEHPPETMLQKQVHLDSALQKSRPPPGFWRQSGRNCETTTQDSCKNKFMEQTMLPERFGQCALFFESTITNHIQLRFLKSLLLKMCLANPGPRRIFFPELALSISFSENKAK